MQLYNIQEKSPSVITQKNGVTGVMKQAPKTVRRRDVSSGRGHSAPRLRLCRVLVQDANAQLRIHT